MTFFNLHKSSLVKVVPLPIQEEGDLCKSCPNFAELQSFFNRCWRKKKNLTSCCQDNAPEWWLAVLIPH